MNLPSKIVNVPSQKNFTTQEKIAYLHGLMDAGYWVFPLHDLTWVNGQPQCTCHLGARCLGPGKHPAGKWSAPLDPREPQSKEYVRNVVTRWPDRGWGLHVGLSGLAVLDIDPRHGGDDTAARLVRNLDLPLRWPTVATSGGGSHYYFAAPAGTDPVRGFAGPNGKTSTNVALGPGVEFFTGQHYVVLPFSPHRSGGWHHAVESGPLGQVPPPLLQFVNKMEVFDGQKQSADPQTQADQGNNFQSRRAEYLGGPPGAARAQLWLGKREPAIAGQGGRKKTAATASALLVDFGLDRSMAWALLVEWNTRNQPPWEADQLRQIFDWADGRPGERGAKLREPGYRTRSATVEALAWLAGVSIDLRVGDYLHSLDPATPGKVTVLPREPVLSQEEVDGLPESPGCGGCSEQTRDVVRSPDQDTGHASEPDQRQCQADVTGKPLSAEQPSQPEPAYVYSSGPACTCSFTVLLHNAKGRRVRVCRMPGRRWDCPSCGPRRREHYKATMRHWLSQKQVITGATFDLDLYTAIVPVADWPRIASSIRIKKGSFFKVDHLAVGSIRGGSLRIVSTVRTSHCEWLPVTPGEAIEIVCKCIDAMPNDIRVRVWWSSRNWKLLPDHPERETQWERVGRLRPSWTAIREVLDAWGLTLKRVRGAGRFWEWTGYQAVYPPGAWEDLRSDLDDGAPISKISINIGLPGGIECGSDGASLMSGEI